MIAKRITSRAAKPRMARLVKYVVAAQGQIDPRSWTRTADYVLCSGISTRGEKVGGVRVTNCNTNDPAAATTLIEVTQAANTRSKTDKTYHLVFSFPPGEEPSLETLHKIEDELVAAIGYADHQRISAVHIDTDHLHVHVAINKVHPTGFQNIEPYYDKKKLMETCERLELEYGLQRTNHGLDGREPKAKVKERQAQAEAHSGIETLTGLVTREVAPRLKEAKSWKEAHSILAEHGLTIKPRGAGLVIGSGDLWVKASQCDRALSFKAMTDRLGPIGQESKQPAKPYEPKPRHKHVSSTDLYEQYKLEREATLRARQNGIKQLKYEGEVLNYQLKKWYIAQKKLVGLAAKGPTRRAMMQIVRMQTSSNRTSIRKGVDAKRRKLVIDTALPSWQTWLARQAEAGKTEALEVLRSNATKQRAWGNLLTARNPEIARNSVMHGLRHHIDKDGLVNYITDDGGVVVDRKTHIQSFNTTAGAALLALELAAKQYGGGLLVIEGTDNFKRDVARLAGVHKINVQFADPAMEKVRKAELPKEKTRGKSQDKGAEL